MFDLATYRLKRAQWVLVLALSAAIILVFYWYSGLTFGFKMDIDHCKWIKWRKDWDWDCVNLGDNNATASVDPQIAVNSANIPLE